MGSCSFFRSAFSCIWSEYRYLHSKFEYGQIQTKRNSDFRQFSHRETQRKMTSPKTVYQISFHSEICVKSNFFLALTVKSDYAYWKAKRKYEN